MQFVVEACCWCLVLTSFALLFGSSSSSEAASWLSARPAAAFQQTTTRRHYHHQSQHHPRSPSSTLFLAKFAQAAYQQQPEKQSIRSQREQSKDATTSTSNHAVDVDHVATTTTTFRGDSVLGELHEFRVKTAGRVGTKRYVNPCKVFLGNLPFNATDSTLQDWLCTTMGLPSAVLLNDVKIVRDWKTGTSKGYGFCVFTEPIYATVIIDKCSSPKNCPKMQGRALRVSQGVKKQQQAVIVKKDQLSKPEDAEEVAIQQGIQEAAATAEAKKKRKISMLDPLELAVLRKLDPDLLVEDDDSNDELSVQEDSDDDDIAWETDDSVGDEAYDDEQVDGSQPDMNRQQRREAAKRKKRRKPEAKGFGGGLK